MKSKRTKQRLPGRTAKRRTCRPEKRHVVALWPAGFVKEQVRGITDELMAKYRMKRVVNIFYNGEDSMGYEPIELSEAQKKSLIARERLFAAMAKKMGPENERRRMMDIRALLGKAWSPFEFEWLYGAGRC